MSSTKDPIRDSVQNVSRFTRSVFDNIKGSELPMELRRDLKESYHFYLDEAEKAHLSELGKVKRAFYAAYYLSKNLILKLTPVRRLIVLVGVVVAYGGMPDDTDEVLFGFLLVLFVLGLELKDKLTAHDELEAGRAVQLAIMPETTPVLQGWEIWMQSTPAKEVGGDLIDHMSLEENTIALTLGDVAGKGLPAALMAAKIQATLRAIAPDYRDLTARAEKLNNIVIRDGLPDKFASMIHCRLTTASGEVCLVNAGHHPPILVKDGKIVELGKGGPAIGLSKSSTYPTETCSMEDGDLLVLYSDGITEARNEVGQFYSEDRFKDLLHYTHGMDAVSLGSRILRSVEDFVRTARPSDDLSLIIIRRQSGLHS
ncbi:MAG: PP2C family protein-serine/threonine phosphatase [Bacteroidetes bacterium]|nr:PP2C family protein-serine/threonine phosphatase [Bacteroidota bacterium]